MMRNPFDQIQCRFLEAFAEALFDGVDMAITPAQVVDNLQTQMRLIGGTKEKEISLSVTAASLALAPFFNQSSVETRRERIKDRLQNSQIDILQDIARLRGLIYAAYFGHWQGASEEDNEDNPVLKQIGFTLPKFRQRAGGEMPITLIEGRDLTHQHFVHEGNIPDDIDIIIVGSGSGGGVSAANMAARGYKVLVIEAGPHLPSAQITHEERQMAARLYKHGSLQTSKDNDFVVFQGRNVGGSSTVNNGICLRIKDPDIRHPMAKDVLAQWHSLGAPIDEGALTQAYDTVQQRLGIRKIEERSGRRNGPHLLQAWAKYAASSDDPMVKAAAKGWFNKNYGPPGTDQACAYCGYCNTGCPYGRKLGTGQSYLLDACQLHDARILADTKVESILWHDQPGGGKRRAIGVKAILEDGYERDIMARVGVIVAAGTIASSKLLHRSQIGGTGTGISLNVASPIIALMGEGGTPCWDEDQMATVVDCGEYLLESHFQPPMSMAAMMPGWFDEHHRRMRNYNNVVSAGVLFPADRRGRIEDGKLHFKLDKDTDLPLLRRAMATLAKVHFAHGAKELYPALLRGQTLTPDMDVDAFFAEAIRESDDVTLSSSHPQGGNPIHTDPAQGVVDENLRVHGTENVMVTDASVFPSCIRVNAHFTTMAIAEYATGRGDPFAVG
ncbi:GMC family oxidoreductase N-terminal domain-containing protein [Sphingorhabdus arenilitoris]|uniref:GMC family oxidoreductase N-terminal domain-containing protein n=1 Tax=Sphingorhabdus arenilitoris TaxID=1490041 RepID=A0ABV8RH65_9SPHN